MILRPISRISTAWRSPTPRSAALQIKFLPVAKEWQQRPLEAVYTVVFLDAIHYHVRSEGQIVKKAVYIAIGINLDGKKDVLGMWVGENESAKFRPRVH